MRHLLRWGTGKVGVDKAEFDELLQKENANFMEVLVGADSNLGVPVSEFCLHLFATKRNLFEQWSF